MTNSKINYYMNNPCIVIRKVSDDFSEIKMNPKFADEMTGFDFCQGCKLGSMDGAHVSHRCDDYQDMIDYINDCSASIIVIVENRLLHDQPIEQLQWINISEKVTNEKLRLKKLSEIALDHVLEEAVFLEKILKVKKDIDDLNKSRNELRIENELINNMLIASRNEYEKTTKLTSGNISLNLKDLRKLYESDFILERLMSKGLDNWEWYSESYPTDDEIENYLSSKI